MASNIDATELAGGVLDRVVGGGDDFDAAAYCRKNARNGDFVSGNRVMAEPMIPSRSPADADGAARDYLTRCNALVDRLKGSNLTTKQLMDVLDKA
jgi:hypothetical protein